MKLLTAIIATLWLSPLFANEMPMTDTQRLDMIEELFEEAEVVKTFDKATGELTGFKLKHEDIEMSDALSFDKEEME